MRSLLWMMCARSSPEKETDASLRQPLNPNPGMVDPPDKIKNLNLSVSTHRDVDAVRLMRIELGGAYADLLNDEEKDSPGSEMEYVEGTLGFRTKDLEDRDFRLVTDIVGGTIRWKSFHCAVKRTYLHLHTWNLFSCRHLLLDSSPTPSTIFRIGCYELVKLEMPAHAVVNENVNLAKVALRPGVGNMVNGILRKLVSLKIQLGVGNYHLDISWAHPVVG